MLCRLHQAGPHPNIVRFVGRFVDEHGATGIIFELSPFRPRDLAKYLESDTLPLGRDVLLQFTNEIASAMAYVASYGILHLDLKPENILCFQQGVIPITLKICDFG